MDCCFFFFSSRRRHTRCSRDWSSDVCSSDLVEQIISIPGIKNLGAQVIVSEIGIEMSRFPSAAHLIAWACMSPRNDESAGKRRSNRLRKGAAWLKTTLVQCAWAAVEKKDSYLQ